MSGWFILHHSSPLHKKEAAGCGAFPGLIFSTQIYKARSGRGASPSRSQALKFLFFLEKKLYFFEVNCQFIFFTLGENILLLGVGLFLHPHFFRIFFFPIPITPSIFYFRSQNSPLRLNCPNILFLKGLLLGHPMGH